MSDMTLVPSAELGGLIRANYEMTREEAVLVNGLMDRAESDYRFYLLKMREEKGWKALGYASFEDYGEKARGLSKSQLYRMAQAAEVQRSLSVSPIGETIPEGQLRPLAPLSDDERRQVWEEAKRAAEEEGRKLTARAVQEAVDRLAAEKAALQGQLDLASQRSEDWRQQALAKEKARADAEAARALLSAASAAGVRVRCDGTDLRASGPPGVVQSWLRTLQPHREAIQAILEAQEERAAIMEYDGGLSRADADAAAFRDEWPNSPPSPFAFSWADQSRWAA